jgi:activator of HSP90 ATPase
MTGQQRFTLAAVFPVRAEKLYKAWLSSKGHSAMTGSSAKATARVGGKFTAWDGYIFGKTLELESSKRILQAWRTTEFPEDAPDSLVEILFKEVKGGTKVTLKHSNMPDDQVQSYKQGWDDFYFKPMRDYFGK